MEKLIENDLIDQFTLKKIFFPAAAKQISSHSDQQKDKGKIVLAMTEGEVHDVGKWVIHALFRFNQFEVIDLGTIESSDQLVKAVKAHQPCYVGLSGMLTSSLYKMQHVAKVFEKEGFDIPLLIGGAGTSLEQTAVAIAPFYTEGIVIYVKDLYHCHNLCPTLNDKVALESLKIKVHKEYEELRCEYQKKIATKKVLPLAEARKKRCFIDWKQQAVKKPSFLGVRVIEDYNFNEIKELIDWTPLFLAFGLKEKYPHVLTHKQMGAEATQLLADAQELMDDIIKEKRLKPSGVVGFFPAYSIGDDIEVFKDEKRQQSLKMIHTLRQQSLHGDDKPYYALADFIAPKESGVSDYLGAFAVTVGLNLEKIFKKFLEEKNFYKMILVKVVADQLVEAFAESLHKKVRKEYWGYAGDENLSKEELFQCRFQGIRPAPGYPACPEHSEKAALFELLEVKKTVGITLTSGYAMSPAASVCGFYFARKEAKYFWLGTMGKDQLEDYCVRKGIDICEAEQLLSIQLNYIPQDKKIALDD